MNTTCVVCTFFLAIVARMVLQRPENGGKMCDGDLVVTEASHRGSGG